MVPYETRNKTLKIWIVINAIDLSLFLNPYRDGIGNYSPKKHNMRMNINEYIFFIFRLQSQLTSATVPGGFVAPISSSSPAFTRSQLTHGIREVSIILIIFVGYIPNNYKYNRVFHIKLYLFWTSLFCLMSQLLKVKFVFIHVIFYNLWLAFF